MHTNSIAAYNEESAKLSNRASEILTFLKRHGPSTDRQIKVFLNYPDMNCVRPRITELIDAKLVHEIGSTIDTTTEKNVRIVAAVSTNKQMTLGI